MHKKKLHCKLLQLQFLVIKSLDHFYLSTIQRSSLLTIFTKSLYLSFLLFLSSIVCFLFVLKKSFAYGVSGLCCTYVALWNCDSEVCLHRVCVFVYITHVPCPVLLWYTCHPTLFCILFVLNFCKANVIAEVYLWYCLIIP